MRTATTLAHPYILHANRHTSWGVTHACCLFSCQYKSHEFNWHSYRKTGKSLNIIIEKSHACSGGRESHPTRGVGLAFTMHVILGQSLQRRDREREGGGGGGRRREGEWWWTMHVNETCL